MYEITSAILSSFDIRKLKNKCNYPNCNKKPEKEIFIYEYGIKRNTGLATLYLCSEHKGAARNLVKKLRSIQPKVIIESKQKTIK